MRKLIFTRLHPDGASHDDIARLLGITRMHVAAIEAAALRKLGLAIRLRTRVTRLEGAMP